MPEYREVELENKQENDVQFMNLLTSGCAD